MKLWVGIDPKEQYTPFPHIPVQEGWKYMVKVGVWLKGDVEFFTKMKRFHIGWITMNNNAPHLNCLKLR